MGKLNLKIKLTKKNEALKTTFLVNSISKEEITFYLFS